MKKFIFLLAVALMASIGYLSAQNSVAPKVTEVKSDVILKQDASRLNVTLKYINGDLATVVGNTFPAGTYYVSGCINFTATQMANYVGGTMTKIRVPIPSTTYMTGWTSCKVWIKTSLAGAVVQEQTFTPTLQTVNEITLTTPYPITAGELVIGFTTAHTVTGASNNIRPLWASSPTATGVPDTYTPGGFNYILTTAANAYGTGASWNQFTSAGNLGIEADLINVPTLPAKDLACSSIASNELKWVGKAATYAVTVFNAGTASQNSYTVRVIDAANNVLGSTPVTTALASGASTVINVSYTPTTANVGNFAVRGKVEITGDENTTNDISSTLTQYVCPMQPMAYCDYSAVTGVAWGASLPHQAAITYTSANMTPFAGKQLTAIRVAFNVPASTIQAGAKVWIRSSLTDATNLYEQTFTPVDGWNTVVLTTPYPLTTSQIYIGWSAQSSQNYIIGCTQNTPVVADGGHIQGGTNAWSNYNAQSPVMPYNNAIMGVVSTPVSDVTITTAVNPTGAGSVTGGGTQPSGSNFTLTATANSGYTFQNWTPGNSTANPLTLTNVTANATYTANFQAASTGDLTLTAYYPYTQIPIGQTLVSTLPVTVKNSGTTAQNNVVVTLKLNGTVIGTTTPQSLAAGATANLSVPTGSATIAAGTNTLTYTVASDAIDDNPMDNTVTRQFTGTATVYATEYGYNSNYYAGTTTSRYGNVFNITNATTLYSVDGYFYYNSTTPANNVNKFGLEIYQVTSFNATNGTPILNATPIIKIDSFPKSATTTVWAAATLPTPLPLSPGNYYVCITGLYSNICAETNPDGRTGYIYTGTGTTTTSMTRAALVRLNVNLVPNDLRAIVATNPLAPYTKIPKSQAAGAIAAVMPFPTTLSAQAFNAGSVAQTQIKASLTLDGAPLGTSTNTIATLNPGATSAAMNITPTAGTTYPTAPGDHKIAYNVSQNETEGNPADNTLAFTLEIGNTYQLDAIVAPTNGVGSNTSTISVGNIYNIYAPTTLTHVVVGHSIAATAGLNYSISLFRMTAALEIESTPLFEVPVTRQPGFTTIKVPTTPLTPGDYYLCVNQLTGGATTDNVGVTYDTRTNARRYYSKTLTGTTLTASTGTQYALALRMIVADPAANVTITTAVSPTGAGSVTGGGTQPSGSNFTLTATANSGYTFQNWTPGNSTANPLTLTNVTANATYTANFISSGGNCNPPTALNVTYNGCTSAALSWTAPAKSIGANTSPVVPKEDASDRVLDTRNSTPATPVITQDDFKQTDPAKAILWDNGPLITHPGAGAGGTNASAINDPYSTLYGSNVNKGLNYSLAEDFTLNAQSTVETIQFFSYQTNAGSTTSTITGAYVRIWKGEPGICGSTVVWGDLTTNRMASTTYSNINRVSIPTDGLTGTARRIMSVIANVNTVLDPGIYWVEWTLTGSLTSGPWAPPVTVLGVPETGNAKQFNGTSWAPVSAENNGVHAMAFIVNGTATGTNKLIAKAPTAFTATPVGTTLVCNLQWTNPAQAFGGAALTTITKMVLERDCQVIQELTPATVGGVMTFTDNTISAGGVYTYSVYAVTPDGNGPRAFITAFVGAPCSAEVTISGLDALADEWSWVVSDNRTGYVYMGGGSQSGKGAITAGTTTANIYADATFKMWQYGTYGDNTALVTVKLNGTIIYQKTTAAIPVGFSVTKDLSCSGSAPSNTSYNVYSDGIKVNTAPITTTNYTATTVDLTAAHTWAVKAICPTGGESNPATKTMAECSNPGNCNPPTALNVIYNGTCTTADLTWTAPAKSGNSSMSAPVVEGFNPQPREAHKKAHSYGLLTVNPNHIPTPITEEKAPVGNWLGRCSQYNSSLGGIGAGASVALDIKVGERYTPADLTAMGVVTGDQITKVRFMTYKNTTTHTNCVIEISQGGSWGASPNQGTIVHTQTVPVASLQNEAWTEVTLSTPVTINPAQELWVMVRYVVSGGYPVCLDLGPGYPQKSNILYCAAWGGWATMLDESISGGWLGTNNMVQAFINGTPTPSTLCDIKFELTGEYYDTWSAWDDPNYVQWGRINVNLNGQYYAAVQPDENYMDAYGYDASCDCYKQTFTLKIPSGNVAFSYVPSTYSDDEASFKIFDKDNNQIYEAPQGSLAGIHGQFSTYTNNCGGTPPANATYNVYCDGIKVNTAPITTTNYTATTVDLSTAHTWAVKAICPDGGLSTAATKDMELCDPGACAPIKNLTYESWEDGRIVLKWEKPDGKKNAPETAPDTKVLPKEFTINYDLNAPKEGTNVNFVSASKASKFANRPNIPFPVTDGDENQAPKNTWDLLWSFDVVPVQGTAGNFAPFMWGGKLYVAKWNSAYLGIVNRFAKSGNTWVNDGSITISGVTGSYNIEGFATDGQFIYGVNEGSVIYKINPATWAVAGTIPISGIAPAAIAYDAVNNGFWLAEYDGSMVQLVSMTGANVSTMSGATNITGLAWENTSDGTPYLWVQDNNGPNFGRWNCTTKAFTANAHVNTGVPGITTYASSAGMFYGLDAGTGKNVLVSLNEGDPDLTSTPDICYAYEMSVAGTLCEKVTNLAANVTNDKVVLTWTAAAGTPTGYEVSRDGTVLSTVTATSYTDNNVPNGTHTYTVKALFTGTCIPAGVSVTAKVAVGFCDNPENVIVGTGTVGTCYYPINTYYNYSYSQTLYDAAEVGDAGRVVSLSFQYIQTTAKTYPIDVYLGNTTKTAFSSTSDWVPVSQLTQVFSGNVPFNNTGTWVTIQFDIPFDYTGGNLVVAVNAKAGNYISSTASFYTTATTLHKNLCYYADAAAISPASPPAASGTYGYDMFRANTKFGMCIDHINYNVYRNATLLTTVDKPTYTDFTANNTISNEYCITVKCEDGINESNKVCVTVPDFPVSPCAPVRNLTAAYGLDCQFAKITWDAPILPKTKSSSVEMGYTGPFGDETPEAEKLAMENGYNTPSNATYNIFRPESMMSGNSEITELPLLGGTRGNTAYACKQFPTPLGYISFDVANILGHTMLSPQTTWGAGECYNGVLYVCGNSQNIGMFYKVNATTGVVTQTITNATTIQLTEMAYNYSNNTMYGLGSNVLYTVNLNTGALTQVAALSLDNTANHVFTFAINLQGQAYGIAADGKLYTINLTSGACTAVGPTGQTDIGYIQSMNFDHNTGILYWAHSGTTNDWFRTVNVSTGQATLIVAAYEMTALHVPYSAQTPCPAVANVTAAVVAGTTQVKINWTPATGGATSTEVARDGAVIATLGGSANTYTDATATPGKHTYCVKAIFPTSMDCAPVSVCAPEVTVPEIFPGGCERVIVGTSTANNYYDPLPGWYGWSRNIILLEASEIGKAGVIKEVSFQISNTNTSNRPMKIYLMHTTNTTVDAQYVWNTMKAQATLVYDKSINFPTAGWQTFTVSDFDYNGTDNLYVMVEGQGCTATGGCSAQAYYTAKTNSHWYSRTDNNPPNDAGLAGSRNNNRPNVRLMVCEDQKEYNIYRDGVLIAANYKGKEYIDDKNDGMDPTANHCWSVAYIRAGEHNLECERTNVCLNACTPPLPCADRIVGTGTGTSYVIPVNNFYNYSYSQQIYGSADIGAAGDITQIAYQYNYATPAPTPIKIYMGYTTQTTFATTSNYVDFSTLTQVYQGNANFNNTSSWYTITLDQPFSYNGTGNLVVAVENLRGSYFTGGTSFVFLTHTTTGNKAVHYYRDASAIDHSNPLNGSPSSAVLAVRNNTKFTVCEPQNIDMAATAVSLCPSKIKAGVPYNVDVTVKNNDKTAPATNYTVEVRDYPALNVLASAVITNPLAPGASITHTFSVTFSQIGDLTIRGRVSIADDSNPLNNQSPNLNINVRPFDNDEVVEIPCPVTVGTGATQIPFNFYYNSSMVQSLYTESEIGLPGGYIKDITWFYNNTGAEVTHPVKVYFATTTKTSLADGWLPASEFTKVYEGTVTVPLGVSELTLPIATPFLYMGGNLVVMTERPLDAPYTNNVNAMTTTVTPDKRTLEYHSDATPFNWTQAGTALNAISNIRLTFNVPAYGVVKGTVSCQGVPIPDVKVTFNEIPGAYKMTDAAGKYSFGFVPLGTYSMLATKFAYYDGVAAPFTVEKDVTYVKDFEMCLLPKVVVFGDVRAADGTYIIGAKLTLKGYENYTVTSTDMGRFEFTNVYAPKEYVLTVTYPGYQKYEATLTITGHTNLGTITLLDIPFPPTGVVASYSTKGDYVDIKWGLPVAAEPKIFRYDNGVATGQLGFSDGFGTLYPKGVIGSCHRVAAVLNSMSWYLTDNVSATPTTVNIYIFALDASGNPTNTVLYSALGVPSTKLAWNTHEFPAPVNAPNGFFITLAGPQEFLSVGTSTPDGDYPFKPNTHFFSSDYTQYSYSTFESQGFSVIPMIRAEGTAGKSYGYAAEQGNTAAAGDPLTYIKSASDISTGDPYESSSRVLTQTILGYKLWRLPKGDQNNTNTWVQLTNTPVDALEYTDYTWPTAAYGSYQWAVKTCYYEGVESEPAFSNDLFRNVEVPYTINITTNSGDTPAGAAVVLSNATNTYQSLSTAVGVSFAKVFCGTYTLKINLAGFAPYTATVTVPVGGGTWNAELKEIINNPYELKIDTACNSALFTWKHDAAKNFSGFTVYLDGEIVKVITNTEQKEYRFVDIPDGVHTAGVQANYASGNSAKVTVDFTIYCLGISDYGNGDYTIYPNPALHYITVKRATSTFASIEIYNAIGMHMGHYETTEAKFDIPVNTFAAGTYFIKVTENDKVGVKSFVKE